MEEIYSDNSTNIVDNIDNDSIVEETYHDMLMDPGEVTLPNQYQNHDEDALIQECIPSTTQGELLYEVVEEIPKGYYVNGHMILNQCGLICSRSNHHIKSYQSQKCFLQ